MTKDPKMLRLGAYLIILIVPFFIYAAFARRDEPGLVVLSLAIAVSTTVFCLWVLRRATRLENK